MKKLKLFVMTFVAMFVAVVTVNAANVGVYGNPAKTAAEIVEALGGDSYAEASGNTVTLKQSIDNFPDLFIGSTSEPIILDLGSYNIKLQDDCQIALWGDANLTIKGTGSISNNREYPTIQLYATGNYLTVDGPTIENKYTTAIGPGGLITGGAIGSDLNTSAQNDKANTIEIKSGIVKGTQGINLNTNGTGKLIVSGGTIEGTVGAAVVVNGNTTGNVNATITGGTIKSNDNDGIGLAVHGRTITTVDGGKFTGWAGIYATSNGDITINKAEVTGTQYGVDGVDNSTIVINGGNITGAEAGVYSQGKTVDVKNGTIDGRYGVVAYDGVKTTISGGEITGDAAAVAGNGSDPSADTTINVTGGSLKGGIVGIYHPQKGKLNISGDAIIEGKSGIVARQGDVAITGGKIKATGTGDNITIGDAKDEGDTSGRVQLPSGVAVIVDNTEAGYEDEAKVTIDGGEFESKKEPLLTYGDEENLNKDIIVTFGSFDQDVALKYLDTDVEQSENGVVGKVSDITFDKPKSGSIKLPKNAAKGESVMATVTPDKGYEIAEIKILNEAGEELPFEAIKTGFIFTMPEGAVTVKVSFKKVQYDIVVEEDGKESTLTTDAGTTLKDLLDNYKGATGFKDKDGKDLDLDTPVQDGMYLVVVKESPNTLDNILTYISVAVLSLGFVGFTTRKVLKRN